MEPLRRTGQPFSPYDPRIGCFLVIAALFLLCLIPVFMLDAAQFAMAKLHLTPAATTLVLMGIVFGGLVNIPLYVLKRDIVQPMPTHYLHVLLGWVPVVQRQPLRTIVAVNVGGCLIPTALAFFEITLVFQIMPSAAWALVMVVFTNVLVCFCVARPLQGIGIAMPGFVSPMVSVLMTWLLLAPDEYSIVRAPVAFVAGVVGPLIGADLLHLRDFSKLAAPVVSIGGAGTFDGIVLSGLLAAFLV